MIRSACFAGSLIYFLSILLPHVRIAIGQQIPGRYFFTAPRILEVIRNLEDGLKRLLCYSYSQYGSHFSVPFEVSRIRRLVNHLAPEIALST